MRQLPEEVAFAARWIAATMLGVVLLAVLTPPSGGVALLFAGFLIAAPQARALRAWPRPLTNWIAVTWGGMFLADLVSLPFAGFSAALLIGVGRFVARPVFPDTAPPPRPFDLWFPFALAGFFGGLFLGLWQYLCVIESARNRRRRWRGWLLWSMPSGIASFVAAVAYLAVLTARYPVGPVGLGLFLGCGGLYSVLTAIPLVVSWPRADRALPDEVGA